MHYLLILLHVCIVYICTDMLEDNKYIMGQGSGRLGLQTIYGTICCNVQLVQNIDDTVFFNVQTYQFAKFN